MSTLEPVVVLCGPTASGKSAIAIEVAKALRMEIVGADSVQVYRKLDIGSGKVSLDEREALPHHLIDVVDPDQKFTAGDYERRAAATIASIRSRGVVPLICGGTGLYLRALLFGLSQMPTVDPAIRQALQSELEQRGVDALYAELQQIDPAWAQKVAQTDRQRIMRGLEIFRSTGQTLSHFQEQDPPRPLRYNALLIGLDVDVKTLRERIAERVQRMLAAGFEAEVQQLLAAGYSPTLKSMQSLGYRQIAMHLAGEIDRDEMIRLIVRDHRRYAKRQRTWFRKMPGIRWLPPNLKAVMQQVHRFVHH